MIDKWNNGEPAPVLKYQGLAGYQWQWLETYGGKLTENLVQFASRCVQADAVLAAEAAGFDVIIHTHDEIVAHNRIGEKTVEELEAIMGTASRSWAQGWPLQASGGWKGERYRK
jgi:DNA polymerase